MFAKLKKDLTKKIILVLWLLFTTLYTLSGIYNYFKVSVYQAWAGAAIAEVMTNVQASQCQKPTILFAGGREVSLIDITCLQTSSNVVEPSDENLN